MTLVVATLLVAAWTDASAQARVTGTIVDRDTGTPLEGTTILVGDAIAPVLTARDGRFRFEDLPAGRYLMRFQRPGYADRQDTLTVLRPGSIDLRVALTRSPYELDPISVEASPSAFLARVGFYDRRASGLDGTFFDRESIEKRDPKLFTDLFLSVPGAVVRTQSMGTRLVRFNRSTGRFGDHPDGCLPDLYVDGLVTGGRPGSPRPSDHDVVDPRHVEAVEVYVGAATPIQYKSVCGVILVWTRHR